MSFILSCYLTVHTPFFPCLVGRLSYVHSPRVWFPQSFQDNKVLSSAQGGNAGTKPYIPKSIAAVLDIPKTVWAIRLDVREGLELQVPQVIECGARLMTRNLRLYWQEQCEVTVNPGQTGSFTNEFRNSLKKPTKKRKACLFRQPIRLPLLFMQDGKRIFVRKEITVLQRYIRSWLLWGRTLARRYMPSYS